MRIKEKIINYLNKVCSLISVITLNLLCVASNVYANNFADPTQVEGVIENVEESFKPLVSIIVSIVLYISILFVGLNVIANRNKGEERSSAMQGFIYIAIGLIIVSSAYLIRDLIMR